MFYGTYLFETHFVFFILARCCCCFWAGLLFTWPNLLGLGARVCTLSSQILHSKIKKVTLCMNGVMSSGLPNIKNCWTKWGGAVNFLFEGPTFYSVHSYFLFSTIALIGKKYFKIIKIKIFKVDY